MFLPTFYGSCTKGVSLCVASSLNRCSKVHIALELCRIIESADPGICPKGQDVRKTAASLLFLCSHSLDTACLGGQWSSTSAFIRCYLATQVDDIPCVAMGSLS
ncbi:hypothetical protein Pcinc_016950 [Petrolisthes cinctipes]|uniref:Uncharacterized protein n=1 Tax=Petrolisthes cinctipes TaxID=88211 RepID=A0AAE1FR80_PETCI|nr:hypothetical protein Pcinc_016950 [Petrolisthes cinctipes]